MKPGPAYPFSGRLSALLAAGIFLTPGLIQAQDPAAPPPEEDIRPAREAVVIPQPPKFTTTQKILTAAAVLAGSGILLWFLMRRRTARLATVLPFDQAREALRGIDAQRETLPSGELAEQTANVVRRFIAANFGLAAPQRTTEEFLKSLTTSSAPSPLQPHTELLRDFLTTCDKAKFARGDFDPVQRFALLETANRFLQAAAFAAPATPSTPPTIPPAP